MYVVCSYHPNREKVTVMGRTDYPDCGDFKRQISPGETYYGLTYDVLITLDGFETDPLTDQVIRTVPATPISPDADRSGKLIPDWLRKKPAP